MRRKVSSVSSIGPAASGAQPTAKKVVRALRPALPVPIPNRPLAPWLRLAHVAGSDNPNHAAHHAYVRSLLDFELVLQISGGTWIWSEADGGSIDIRAGELAFIPPGFSHGWASEPGQHIAVHFDFHAQPRLEAMDNIRMISKLVTRKPIELMPQFALSLPDGWSDGNETFVLSLVTPLRAPALWREKLDPLILLYSRRAHHTFSAQLLAAETIGWALRTLIADARHAAGNAGGASRESDAQIMTLLRELETAPSERQSVSGLARRAHMGLTAFRDAFRRVTGRGPRAYLEERCIERAARRLLETDGPVLEIAESEGFGDPYHFSRVFKRVMGISPRAYRQRRRNGN